MLIMASHDGTRQRRARRVPLCPPSKLAIWKFPNFSSLQLRPRRVSDDDDSNWAWI